MSYLGDITLGDTIHCKFTTVATTGAPTTLAGVPVVSAYVGGSLTQITAGITLTVDYDGVTGFHDITVVASGANGYTTATNVALVITTGTVGGTSVVGYVVGSFSIGNRSAFARLGAPAGASVSADVAAMKVDTAAILVDTAEIGAAGAGLTNINLPNQTMDITGNITGNLSGSVGSVTGAVGSVTGLTAANLDAAISTRATPAQVNTEVLDCLVTDTHAELAAVPAATSSLKDKINWLFALARNKITQTATTTTIRNDADGADIATSTTSDNGTTATRGEWT